MNCMLQNLRIICIAASISALGMVADRFSAEKRIRYNKGPVDKIPRGSVPMV